MGQAEGQAPAPPRTSKGKAAEIERLITPSLEVMGYAIVRVLIMGKQSPVLQVMVERKADGGMTVDDCATVSRAAAAILDVEDPIRGAYTLEVSSPGIDRPLTRLEDFDRFAGFEARVELQIEIEGRRRFKGRLLGCAEESVRLETEEGEISLPFAEISKAKLVLTNELIATASHPHNA